LEGPEVHTPHRHAGGLPRWLELLIAVTALITSISSIAIALHHGEIMEKLVEASSLPYIQGGFSDTTLEGGDIISLDLYNRGVGPANEQSLRVKVGGKYVTSFEALITAVVGPAEAPAAIETLKGPKNVVPTRFIPAGQGQFIFRVTKTPENAVYWDKLKTSLDSWDAEYCFCSVFHECWRSEGQWGEPKPVKQCLRDEKTEFHP
jgi:hypothetical protein